MRRDDTIDFAGHKSPQALEFALARRIMPQEFIGQANRS